MAAYTAALMASASDSFELAMAFSRLAVRVRTTASRVYSGASAISTELLASANVPITNEPPLPALADKLAAKVGRQITSPKIKAMTRFIISTLVVDLESKGRSRKAGGTTISNATGGS